MNVFLLPLISVTEYRVASLKLPISSMKTSLQILGFYEFCWRIYDQVLIALIAANPPVSLAVCRC